MSDWVILAAGLALLAGGWMSRRPWGRWWSGGGDTSEQVATLLFPAMGLLLSSAGLGMLAESGDAPGAVVGVLGAVALLGLVGGIWVVLSLPVPDRFLVEGSSIRASRARRQQRRRTKRKEAR